ncbi:MAG: cytochrome c biogenesis protein CcdA [Bryobacteraceae bacterium]
MKRILLPLLAAALSAPAQKPGQVEWKLSVQPAAAPPGGAVLARLEARLERGWHLYSATTGGAIPFSAGAGGAAESVRIFQQPPTRAFDPNFNTETETYEGQTAFLLETRLRKDAAAGPAQLEYALRYQTCNEKLCVPGKQTVTASITVDPAVQAAAIRIPAGFSEAKPGAPAPAPSADNRGLAAFLAIAFGFGLAAIFTPCVFPMIPITVSFFINRQSGIYHALVFSLGIIVLFSGMGLAITAIMGPFGIVQIGSNPWVNGFIAVVFLAFALSLLGAFEITIPSSVLTKLDRTSQRGGVLGTLLMGLTFSLTSFACVGPFVGTLLAASVQGGGARPVLGMVAFAAGLALPFFLLALFPSYLKKLPRSGGWMARVKVVMAFVILAAMLKYLSGVDQVLQWNLITRERFLAAWVVLFAMPGLYLLGFLPLEGVKRDETMGLGRLFTGMAFLIFALSLAPGMFGGRLGELDAYVPAPSAQTAGQSAESGPAWMKNQYREALARARAENKMVLVAFTGYACTNCHWMKANMFTRPEVIAALKNFVLVELYTDGADAASEANQQLQESRFATVAIPYYAIMTPDDKVVASFPGLTRDPREYLAFLQKGAAAPESASPGLTTMDGAPVDLKGKIAVVNFWATWCVPCIAEIPAFNRLHERYAARGVTVVGISMDEEGAESVRPFLAKHPMRYPVVLGDEKLGDQYKVGLLPTTVIFDRSGKEIRRFEGYLPEASLETAVQSAL